MAELIAAIDGPRWKSSCTMSITNRDATKRLNTQKQSREHERAITQRSGVSANSSDSMADGPNRAPRTTRPAAFVLRADVAVAVPFERSHEVERGRTVRMNFLRRDERLIGRQELRGAAAAVQTDEAQRAGQRA